MMKVREMKVRIELPGDPVVLSQASSISMMRRYSPSLNVALRSHRGPSDRRHARSDPNARSHTTSKQLELATPGL